MEFNVPTINLFGVQAIEQLSPKLQSFGWTSCLIITDALLLKTPGYQRIIKVLTSLEIRYEVYDQTKPDPSSILVDEAKTIIAHKRCDFVLTFGGGSAHDLGKAVAMMHHAVGEIKDFVGVNQIFHEVLPVVAVNTTSGTGSEVTRFAIITDPLMQAKLAIIDDKLIPKISVNDTGVLLSMPPALTGATGMDALTHAMEAYLSTDATVLTNAYALEAIGLIEKNLWHAYKDGADVLARENMAKAQFMAGIAFSNASLGYVHGIAHQIGALYHKPHGVCNAVLLPIVLEELYYKDKRLPFGELGRAFGAGGTVYNLIQKIKRMNEKMGIPTELRALGVREEELSKIATMALADPCVKTSPVSFTKEEIEAFLASRL